MTSRSSLSTSYTRIWASPAQLAIVMCEAPGRNLAEKMFCVWPVEIVSSNLKGYGFSAVAATSLSGFHIQILQERIQQHFPAVLECAYLVSSPAAINVPPSSDHESAFTHPVLPTSAPSPSSAQRSTSFHTREFARSVRLSWLARLAVVDELWGGHRDVDFPDRLDILGRRKDNPEIMI